MLELVGLEDVDDLDFVVGVEDDANLELDAGLRDADVLRE